VSIKLGYVPYVSYHFGKQQSSSSSSIDTGAAVTLRYTMDRKCSLTSR